MKRTLYFSRTLIIVLCLTAWYGCANIVPPEGGTKDEKPPVLLSVSPADSSLNLRPSKIVFYFDEYVEVKDLERNLHLSPLLAIPPVIMSYGKRVEIKLADTQLNAQTTYRLELGDAIVDNHEGNPYKNLSYMFSTGSYFDSLELPGHVYDALTGNPDTTALITLYEDGAGDTAVLRRKPKYATKTNADGSFTFRSLPGRPFRVYAIQDANNNYVYDPGEERVGFMNTAIFPSLKQDTSYNLFLFKEAPDSSRIVSAEDSAATGALAAKPSAGGKARGNKTGYQVNVDTSRTQRTVELTAPLTIDLFAAISSIDTPKVYLSYENEGIEVEAIQQLKADSARISIHTAWQPDHLYTLRLVKGWAKDTTGAELPPGKFFFRTKRTEDYGSITIHVHRPFTGDSFLLYVYRGNDSIFLQPLRDSTIRLSLLQPGSYGMRIIADANRNGRWDPGNLLSGRQPERVIPHSDVIVLKAGWEHEADFDPSTGKSKKPKIPVPGVKPGANEAAKPAAGGDYDDR